MLELLTQILARPAWSAGVGPHGLVLGCALVQARWRALRRPELVVAAAALSVAISALFLQRQGANRFESKLRCETHKFFSTASTRSGCRRFNCLALRDFYSITSSARPSSVIGNVRPSALAVFMLMISSTLVDCCTGRSDGFSPLRIRPV